MKVFKFGGASVCDSNAVRNMRDIIQSQGRASILVVISAMGKSTNALERILALKNTAQNYLQVLAEFKEYHANICEELFDSDHLIFQKLEQLFQDLHQSLNKQYDNNDKMYDQVISFGELISTTIVHSFLNQSGMACQHLDARDLIITDSTFREGKVCWSATKQAINSRVDINFSSHYLTQGFIGADQDGNTVTLGREGSDFTAAIFASCLEAESVTIWKDVPGILNADPDLWQQTVKYDNLSYGEAAEMTYYGATVIHPKTIRPLAVKKIPLMVKSFIDPSAEGTRIGDIQHDKLEPALIFKKNQCLISFQVRDFSFVNESKLSIIFHLFEEFNINVNMMQSSAISFSVCVDSPDKKMKSLINGLSADFDILYNDHLELITVKNYQQELISNIRKGKNILLEQRTRKNYQMLIAASEEEQQENGGIIEHGNNKT